ncbi:hypothetical protein E6O75_ATG01566 [Venturia nashicola]|uniref:Uncharacterized protein n=1 Tax=Venturia nashicola TaxID=86259 RepID=A0A4Z1PF64_9PEZI|nr:hypothetical protein E6O75_ATG01566 [Venturia nashicola]
MHMAIPIPRAIRYLPTTRLNRRPACLPIFRNPSYPTDSTSHPYHKAGLYVPPHMPKLQSQHDHPPTQHHHPPTRHDGRSVQPRSPPSDYERQQYHP